MTLGTLPAVSRVARFVSLSLFILLAAIFLIGGLLLDQWRRIDAEPQEFARHRWNGFALALLSMLAAFMLHRLALDSEAPDHDENLVTFDASD